MCITMDRLSKAKIKLMLRGSDAFISTLVLSLNTVIDPDIDTACTDGLEIRYSPTFVATLSDDELIFLVAHETWHVAFMHMVRLGSRDAYRWNCACDYVINLMLVNNGYKMIEGGLIDKAYEGMSAEEVYKLLKDSGKTPENPQDGDFKNATGESKPGQASPKAGEPGEGQGSGPTAEEIEQKIEDAIIKAATAAQMANQAGSIPGGIAKMVDEILNPRLPWQVILSQYMSAKVKTDKSWSRRNKRFKSVYLPSRLGEAMGNVNIYVDASGSVSNAEFTAYITEMHDIRDSLKPDVMKVISFDTQLKEEFVMEKGEDIEVAFSGGGGTCIGPVIDHMESEETDVTIIFTDGYFSNVDYTQLPNDVIWIIVNNANWTCPVGEVIHMEFNGNDLS